MQKIRTTPSGLGIGAAQRVGGFSTLGDLRIGDYRLQGRVRDTGSGAGLAIQSSRVRGPQPDWRCALGCWGGTLWQAGGGAKWATKWHHSGSAAGGVSVRR